MMTEKLIIKLLNHAKKQIAHCPYCKQHDAEFMKILPPSGKIFVFSCSPAFKYNGRWYHLQLCAPNKNSRGGYRWGECQESDHHEYIAMIEGEYTFEQAVEYATQYMRQVTAV